ncbi:hypothetical protein POG02_09985 [Collinsella aerofaciens]|nr:hypothetical protein [Collinsella aerofaciens]
MNIRIHSRTSFPRILEETLFQAYQEGKRSVDFLLLFPVEETKKDSILDQVKAHSVVLDAKWRFGTVLFTAYIRH